MSRTTNQDDMRLFGFAIGRPCTHRVKEALGDGRIGIDAAVAQEGPVAAGVFKQRHIDLADEDLFFFVRGLGDDAAKRVGNETAAPEFKAAAFDAVAEDISLLVAYAIDAGNVDTVGDGVSALD